MLPTKTNRLFGTDGIRSVAGTPPLDLVTVARLGTALVRALKKPSPKFLLGRDTRESGTWIERELVRGARLAGARCVSVGVLPTPAVALLTHERSFDAGIVISASHNPYQDNGIKLFSSTGEKFNAEFEAKVEAIMGDASWKVEDVVYESIDTDDWVDGAYLDGTSTRSSAYITEDGYIVNVPAPYSLEYIKTGKRFIIRVNDDSTTSLVFGGGLIRGSTIEETRLLQTDQAGIVIPGETQNALEDAIDPLSSDASSTLGETPANTTLTITYRVGGGINSNTTSGDISSIYSKNILNGVSDSGKNL